MREEGLLDGMNGLHIRGQISCHQFDSSRWKIPRVRRIRLDVFFRMLLLTRALLADHRLLCLWLSHTPSTQSDWKSQQKTGDEEQIALMEV